MSKFLFIADFFPFWADSSMDNIWRWVHWLGVEHFWVSLFDLLPLPVVKKEGQSVLSVCGVEIGRSWRPRPPTRVVRRCVLISAPLKPLLYYHYRHVQRTGTDYYRDCSRRPANMGPKICFYKCTILEAVECFQSKLTACSSDELFQR